MFQTKLYFSWFLFFIGSLLRREKYNSLETYRLVCRILPVISLTFHYYFTSDPAEVIILRTSFSITFCYVAGFLYTTFFVILVVILQSSSYHCYNFHNTSSSVSRAISNLEHHSFLHSPYRVIYTFSSIFFIENFLCTKDVSCQNITRKNKLKNTLNILH